MYKPKYQKTNLRNPKHDNPNPRDSDLRERKSTPHQRSLGLARPGSCTVVVCLGCAQWSEANLKPPTLISIFSLSLSLFPRFFSNVLVVLL